MTRTAQILFEYLQNVLLSPENATLNIDELEEDYKLLGKGLVYLVYRINEIRHLASALSKGDLGIEHIPKNNELAAPLKALHANLRHLTWQSQQVAKGDYQQQVDFMGDFAEAFNRMTEQLDSRQRALEEEIRIGKEKTEALLQSNSLLTSITYSIPQMILVISGEGNELLFSNRSAQTEIDKNPDLIANLASAMRERSDEDQSVEMEYAFDSPNGRRYFAVRVYRIFWNGENALAYTLSDVSDERKQRMELEEYAYRDNLTKLFNRFYGMKVLQKWIDENRSFIVSFSDLDNLKYVNDTYGHSEGDEYIVSVARSFAGFSPETIACRVGGDEFLLLTPDMELPAMKDRMEEIREQLQQWIRQNEKPYYCNISYGAVSVDGEAHMTAKEALSIADERMYENKRYNKKIRLANDLKSK